MDHGFPIGIVDGIVKYYYNEISEFCAKTKRPIYITKNGRADLTVINSAEFDRMLEIMQLYTATLSPAPESITFHSKEELYRMLDEGLEAVRQGNVRPIEEAFPEIKRRLGFDV